MNKLILHSKCWGTGEKTKTIYKIIADMFSTDHLHTLIVHFPIALITAGFFAKAALLFFKSEKCLSKTGFMSGILVYNFMLGQ